MGSELKQILKSLCSCHGWAYAVFWHYDQINSMLLTFEDAYHDEQFRTVVEDMLQQVHIFGEGIIGEAALTGNHRWMFADTAHDMFQTILVVPIGSSGVVQLGSTQKMEERSDILEETRRALQQKDGGETLDLDALFSSLVPLEDSNVPNEPHSGFSFDDIFAPDSSSFPALAPSSFVSDVYQMSETADPDTLISYSPCGDDLGFDILNSYTLDDLYQLLDESPDLNPTSAPLNTAPGALLQEDYSPVDSFVDDLQETSAVIQSGQSDLFNILGLTCKDSSSSSAVSGNRWESYQTALPPSPKGLFSELGITELISSSFCKSSSSVTSHTHPEDSCLFPTKRRKLDTSPAQSSGTSFFGQSSNIMMPQTMTRTMWSSEKTSIGDGLSKSESCATSMSGLWNEDRYSSNVGGIPNSGEPKKTEQSGKRKRGKGGDSARPRPKDRQMIQDRIKELRGMIPNGAKCSIDALLDLTIKHMLFMQSIAKYSDQLKQAYEPKLINQRKGGRSEEEEVSGERNGATWGFEVGDESAVCPILVEDLKAAGQMQIEMVCEERGEFLEIADVIRGMGLNILKGVMETRNSKIWAHFIVEARRQVTRLQVFWSLVQLQQEAEAKADRKED